ncbi:MAG: biotin--[acetyl-CoA-carboxylase] ligase [Actinomycetota bacterium]|nr:biotin--[acetyl-CoA-carboxylase] ligase [Actinomycetota bacterium]
MKVYFFDEVENTQELAISKFSSEPILIIARKQLKGRGRKGNDWENADQALACSFAFSLEKDHQNTSLLPLIAGYEFSSLYEERKVFLKWPNDLIVDEKKIGGILVEKSKEVFVTGIGINYFWKSPNILSAGSLFDEEVSYEHINEYAQIWATNYIESVDRGSFSLEGYVEKCETIGKLIEYPQGRGWAKNINNDGSLLIEKEDGETISIYESMISEVSL